ncbi:hypothetical protein EDB87DRAFT_1573326 [Lactarius vividus]|nr:hypothetical protein EDB87DRAFT_1573326 [Lactarius vividus]
MERVVSKRSGFTTQDGRSGPVRSASPNLGVGREGAPKDETRLPQRHTYDMETTADTPSKRIYWSSVPPRYPRTFNSVPYAISDLEAILERRVTRKVRIASRSGAVRSSRNGISIDFIPACSPLDAPLNHGKITIKASNPEYRRHAVTNADHPQDESAQILAGFIFGLLVCHAPRFPRLRLPMRDAAGGSQHRCTCGNRDTVSYPFEVVRWHMQVDGLTEAGWRCGIWFRGDNKRRCQSTVIGQPFEKETRATQSADKPFRGKTANPTPIDFVWKKNLNGQIKTTGSRINERNQLETADFPQGD